MFEMHLNRTGNKADILLDNILPQLCVMIISFQFTKWLCNREKHFAEEHRHVLTVACSAFTFHNTTAGICATGTAHL